MSGPRVAWALAGVLAAATAGCSDGGGNGPGRAVISVFEGVLGGDDGATSGTFSITFYDDSTGTGTATLGGSVAQALNAILNADGSFSASGGPLTVEGDVTSDDLDGTFTSGAGGGLATALRKLTGSSFTRFCAAHSGSVGDGVYAFVWNPANHKVRGVWTTAGASFSGIISGEDAQAGGAGAVMSGHTGTVTILPELGPPASLSGFYDLDSGENGSMTGTLCEGSTAPTILATFEGVLGGADGVAGGILSFQFLSDNTGVGTFKTDGGVAEALGVILNGSSFTATGADFSITGTFTDEDLTGTYTSSGGDGLVAAIKSFTGDQFLRFCGSHNGSEGNGLYAFIWNPANHSLRGVWSTVGSAFQGWIAGEDGDGAGTMSGFTGTVTILPQPGPPPSVSGFYDLDSGESGSMSGSTCS